MGIVERTTPPQVLPLAIGQRGIWVSSKIAPSDSVFNISEYVQIEGALVPALFIRALYALANEAETARTRIVDTDDGPRQVIEPYYAGTIPFIDFTDETNPLAAAEAWMMAELSEPVDLAGTRLWFSALLKLGDERWIWYHRCHHIILDGFGGGLLARRCAELYSALVEKREPEPCPFGSFATIVESEQAYRSSVRHERDRDYWRERLAGLPEPISLAKRRAAPTGGLLRSTARLSQEKSVLLREIAKQAGGTMPQVLIALLAAYIYRVSGADDLVMGMPVTGRTSGVLRRIPGMMANAIAVRLAMSPEVTLGDLVQQVSKAVMGGLRHQQYRYEDLRRDLGLLRQDQQISWTGINIEPFDYDLRFGGLPSSTHNLSNGSVEDLTIFVYDRDDGRGLRIDFDANPGLYTTDELQEHQERLVRLIEAVIENPSGPIGALDILSRDERRLIETAWNDTAHKVSPLPWIAEFEAQAELTPERLAVADATHSYTYATLNEEANRLAHTLLAHGIGPGSLIAVALPRNRHLPASLIAIHKAGAAYLPLDPEAPPARLALTLEDAQPALLLTTSAIAGRLPVNGLPCLFLDRTNTAAAPARNPVDADRKRPLSGADTAYVIYTSGSTGRPKGVVVPHRGLTNFLGAMRDALRVTADDRLVAVTTIAFDIAALELYLPLTLGAALTVVSRDVVRDPAALSAVIKDFGATFMQATPSLWQALLDQHAAELRGLLPLVGGEALPPPLARALHRLSGRVINLYGPTETTIWSTVMELAGRDLDSPPIGRPIWNTSVHVLDRDMKPVPVGIPGDLYIGGLGVADGYLRRPELTAERFVADPFGAPGARLYKTGDLARWRGDGVLEFLGRSDFQIKIRGFRVEAGEIEAALAACPGVRQNVVVLREEAGGDKRLVAYLVPEAGAMLDAGAIRQQLEKGLPDYMIPSAFVALEALPVNPNGKLDRGALPAPQYEAKAGYVAPRTPMEEILAALWAESFKLERVGIHDNLFELGGDSLAAARMIATLRSRHGIEIPLGAVFGTPTIAGLAEALERNAAHDPFAATLALKASGKAAPLFCLHPVLGLGWGYGGLLRHLGQDRPVYALQARGITDGAPLPTAIPAIAADYLAEIRRLQPKGPYHLLGWSFGGLIAHEITRLLEAAGERVAFLGLLDAYPFVTDKVPADEAAEVLSAMSFLGYARSELDGGPLTMARLAAFIIDRYDVLAIPAVQDMQRKTPDLFANIEKVIENNMRLARRFTPGRIAADVTFVRATQGKGADLDQILHHHARAWKAHVGGAISVTEIDCHHQDMLDPATLGQIGPVLAAALAAAGVEEKVFA